MRGELLVDFGLCTPIGISSRMSLACMRAGTVRFTETEVLDDLGEPIRASRLELLDPSLSRTERMIALGREALAEVKHFFAGERTKRVPVYLGLPERGVGAEVEKELLISAVLAVAPGQLDVVGVYEGGRAGFFEALVAAQADLRSGRRGSLALVGAVDSLCDAVSLRDMAVKQVHLGPKNPDGRIPGEAAGFVILANWGMAKNLEHEAGGVLLGGALGVEPRPFAQRAPSLGEGLTHVFQTLRANPAVGTRRVDSVLACQPGESFWPTEFSRAYLRSTGLMPEPLHVKAAGEYLGDAGAGAGPVMLGAALHRPRRQRYGSSRALVYGSADGGLVGACVVETIAAM